MKPAKATSRLFLVLLLVLLASAHLPPTHAASFQGLGDLPGGSFWSYAKAVSADGSVVVGGSSTGVDESFYWTEVTGMMLLGPNAYDGAYAVSADGSVIVGGRGANRAYRWTTSQGMEWLDAYSAYGLSADGSVVVGMDNSGDAYRWTAEEGILSLGLGTAYDVSADGSVVVGGRGQAFRWTTETGTVPLGDLSGGAPRGTARAISSDGQVIVGWCGSPVAIEEAFRWENGTLAGLGVLSEGDIYSVANGVSGDGSIVVGASGTDFGMKAFIWDASHGMRDLQQVLEIDYGLDLTGWSLQSANDITPDSQTIVGWGINPDGHTEGWVAHIPEPATLSLLALAALALPRRKPPAHRRLGYSVTHPARPNPLRNHDLPSLRGIRQNARLNQQ